MILFFEGPDGSGKTTLLTRLVEAAPAHGLRPVVAPALWTFIDAIAVPEDFADWVTTTPGDDVARHLLEAMCRRINALIDEAASDADRTTVKLVDRGPKTVLCSARAHMATRGVGDDSARVASALEENKRQLDVVLTRLASVETLLAVELWLPNVSLMIGRLARSEQLNMSYIQYLDSLRANLAATARHRQVRHISLPAEHEADLNLLDVLDWLSRQVP